MSGPEGSSTKREFPGAAGLPGCAWYPQYIKRYEKNSRIFLYTVRTDTNPNLRSGSGCAMMNVHTEKQ